MLKDRRKGKMKPLKKMGRESQATNLRKKILRASPDKKGAGRGKQTKQISGWEAKKTKTGGRG